MFKGKHFFFPVRPEVIIEPLTICNMNCSYCYARRRYKWGQIWDKKKTDLVIKSMPNQVCRVDIKGGEPTLFPWIEYLVSHLLDQGHYVCVTSNGIKAARLKRFFLNPRFTLNLTWHNVDISQLILDLRFAGLTISISTRGDYINNAKWCTRHDIEFDYVYIDDDKPKSLNPEFIHNAVLTEYKDCPRNFKGWLCYDWSFTIRTDGQVLRACRSLGNLFMGEVDLKKELTPTICNRDFCAAECNLVLPKFKL